MFGNTFVPVILSSSFKPVSMDLESEFPTIYDQEVRRFRFISAKEGSVTLKSTLSSGITAGGTARVELMTAFELRRFLFGRERGRRCVCSNARSNLALLVVVGVMGVGVSRISLGMLAAGARGEEET